MATRYDTAANAGAGDDRSIIKYCVDEHLQNGVFKTAFPCKRCKRLSFPVLDQFLTSLVPVLQKLE